MSEPKNEPMDKRHSEVLVYPYDPLWATEYEEERDILLEILTEKGLHPEIHHIGSTSVVNMSAKQIIDMLVILPDAQAVKDAVAIMIHSGYTFLGDGGRIGRYFLSCDDSKFPYYPHVTTADNQVARDQLLFKEILRHSRDIMWDYMAVKVQAAELYPHERGMYRTMKGYFIDAVLKAYAIGQSSFIKQGTEESVPATAAAAAEKEMIV